MITFRKAIELIDDERLVQLALVGTLGGTTANQISELEYAVEDLQLLRRLLKQAINELPNSDDITVVLAKINLEFYSAALLDKMDQIVDGGTVKLGADFYEFEKLILSFQHVKERPADDFVGLSHSVKLIDANDSSFPILHMAAALAFLAKTINSLQPQERVSSDGSWGMVALFYSLAAICLLTAGLARISNYSHANASALEQSRNNLLSFVAGHDALKTNCAAYFAVKLMSVVNFSSDDTPQWEKLVYELKDAIGRILPEEGLVAKIKDLSEFSDGEDAEKVHDLIQEVSLGMNQIFDHDRLMELAIIWAKKNSSTDEHNQDMIEYLHEKSFSRWPFADFSVFKVGQLQYSWVQLEQFCRFVEKLSADELSQFKLFCEADLAGQRTTAWDNCRVHPKVADIINNVLGAMKEGAGVFIENTLKSVLGEEAFDTEEEKFIATRLLTCTRLNLNAAFKSSDENKSLFKAMVKEIAADDGLVHWLGKVSQLEFDYFPELFLTLISKIYDSKGSSANNVGAENKPEYASHILEIGRPMMRLIKAWLEMDSDRIKPCYKHLINFNDLKRELLQSLGEGSVDIQAIKTAIETKAGNLEEKFMTLGFRVGC